MPPRSIAPENVQEVLTLNDINSQILSNAEVLFKQEKDLKVISGQNENGLTHYTSIVAGDSKSAAGHKEFRTVLSGPAESSRRASMLALLKETEKRVAKHVMKK